VSVINPYEPPRAQVADIESSAVIEPRPRKITIALVVLWVFLAINVLRVVGQIRAIQVGDSLGTWLHIAFLLALVIIPAFLFLQVARGGGWARFGTVLFYGGDLMFRIYLLSIGAMTTSWLVEILTVIHLMALGTLYLPTSNAWFRSRSAAA
jgi:hypothetical protein